MSGPAAIPDAKRAITLLAAFSAVAMLLFASCAPPRPAVDVAAEARSLTRLDEAWSKVAATHDADRLAAYYAPDAVVYPPNDVRATGRPAAQKVWAAAFADTSYDVAWSTDHAEVANSGELGFTTGTYEESFRGPDGKPVHDRGKYLCVWAKQADGSWKAAHDMWNPDTK